MPRKIYAVRVGFGVEGHGEPIIITCADSKAECDIDALAILQDQFGGAWVSKFRDTYIGNKSYLLRTFPLPKGYKTKDLKELLENYTQKER